MALFLTEDDVGRLLTMNDAIEALDDAFRQMADDKAPVRPRQRVKIAGGTLQVMPAALPAEDAIGFKAYTTMAGRPNFHFVLYDSTSGELLALMQANRLGQIRTGAASGVATRYLARNDVSVFGSIGTGWQARSQVEAVCAARQFERGVAYGRDPERLNAFCEEMSRTVKLPIEPAASANDVARQADVLIAATNSRRPVFDGNSLSAGVHINAIGSNGAERQEVDEATVVRANRVVVDLKEQAIIECGDVIPVVGAGRMTWGSVVELADIVVGRASGRDSEDEITLFESQGIALEDVAVGIHIYRLARERGIGQEIPA